jgi:hypothetical protein
MKMTAFWDTAPCSLVDVTDVSKVIASEISLNSGLHGAVSHEAVIFIS